MSVISFPPSRGTVHGYVPLGSVRFLLALLVFFGHALAPFLRQYQGLGLQTAGVAVFFIISGYVIASAYYQFYHDAPGHFVANRFLRIFPPFWGTYLLALLAAYFFDRHGFSQITPREFIGTFMLFGGYLGVSVGDYVPHAWTLAVEFQFYFAATVVFFLCHAVKRPRLVAHVLVAGAVAGYVLIKLTHGQHRFFGALQYGPLFGFGVAVFALRDRLTSRVAGMIAAAALLALSLDTYGYYVGEIRSDGSYTIYANLIFVALVALFVVMSFSSMSGRLKKFDKRVGGLTYHLYLTHLPVLILLTVNGDFSRWQDIPVALALSMLASVVMEKLTDRPVMYLRDRIRGSRLQ